MIDTPTEAPQEKAITKTKVVKKELPFELLVDDYATKAKRIAELRGELGSAEAEFETHKANFKAVEKRVEGEITELVRTIRDKKEVRLVDCELIHDYARAQVYYLFEGSIFESRDMTSDERQQSLRLETKQADWIEEQKKAEAEKAAASTPDNVHSLEEKRAEGEGAPTAEIETTEGAPVTLSDAVEDEGPEDKVLQ